MPDIRRHVVETVERFEMLEPWAPVVLAISGGADSTAMLRLLAELRGREIPAFQGHVAHLHHGIRGRDADRDADFVRALADEAEMDFCLERADVPRMARAMSIGLEEAGRRARYDFFQRVAEETGAATVATAHHADDNVETVLMRVARGMTYRALAGIPPVRPIASGSAIRVVRPLIECRRADIEEYLAEAGQDFREDATNYVLDNLRNRIRHKVIPRMENRLLPGVSDSILRSVRAFRRSRRGLMVQALGMLESPPVRSGQGRIQFPARWLASLSPVLAGEVVHQALVKLVPDTDDLTAGHHQAVLDLARTERSTGAVHLPGGILARREHRLMDILAEEPPSPPAAARTLPLADGEVELPGFGGRLAVVIHEEGIAALEGFLRRRTPDMALLDAGKLTGEVAVRAWREGDRMRPLGAPGTRKLHDIFIDLKVPRSQRRRTPILTLDDEPVWIVGYRIAEKAKVGPETRRAVEFRFERGEGGWG